MSHRRRLAALALLFPAWIVMILAGSEWCLMPGSASARLVVAQGSTGAATTDRGVHASTTTHASHAMQLTESVAAGGDANVSVPAQQSSEHRSHHSGDSRACTSAAACSVAVASPRWTLVNEAPHAERPLLSSVDRPSSIALAPELPPPRA